MVEIGDPKKPNIDSPVLQDLDPKLADDSETRSTSETDTDSETPPLLAQAKLTDPASTTPVAETLQGEPLLPEHYVPPHPRERGVDTLRLRPTKHLGQISTMEAVALKGIMQSSAECFSVPNTYPELQARYGPHIEKLLMRANQFSTNFEDLHHYVWVKLLEAKLLERFQEHMRGKEPRTLTAVQACDALGVTWQEWVLACVASHTGQRVVSMPIPVNVEEFNIQGISWYDAPAALFAYIDVLHLSHGELIERERYFAFDRWGLGVPRPEKPFNIPTIHPTANQFKNYLTMAVLNHYANFCRTLKRRHKERPQNPQGDEGHMTSWEDTLVEQKQPSIEVKLQLSEARAFLRTAIQSCLKEMGIPSGGDEEGRIFAQLEQGASLIQALKQCGFSTKVRKSVIESIRSRSEGPSASEELD